LACPVTVVQNGAFIEPWLVRALIEDLYARGVATAGDTGDASPVRPTMSPYIKMTTDSLSSELTFDE